MSVTVPLSSLADTVVDRLTTTFAEAADPARAARMRAYMKDAAPFLGLASPIRRDLARPVLTGTPRPDVVRKAIGWCPREALKNIRGTRDATAVRDRCVAENHSTDDGPSAMIVDMFRHASPSAPSAVADAVEAAASPLDGARR